MKKNSIYISALVLISALFIASCGSKGDDNPTPTQSLDRKPMLENYANNYVVPAYADMIQQLTDLKSNVTTFTSTPDAANLAAARTSFRTAYKTWQKVDLVQFFGSPADNETLRDFVNIYPVTVSKVDNNISTGSYDLETFGNKDARGFAAVDYLLSGVAGNDADIVLKYTTDAAAANRKQYLLDVVQKMLDKVTTVSNAWTSFQSNFVNSTSTDANSSISNIVNGYVLYYERYLRGGKVGLPVGAMTGLAAPQLAEAYYTPNLSKELAIEALTATLNFYNGKSYNGTTTGESLHSYFTAIGTKDDNGVLISDLVASEMTEAITALNGLNTTIVDGVQNNRPQVLGIYEQIQDVVPLIKVDMVSAFSISITYTDNDGD